jgi:hypothetical protein
MITKLHGVYHIDGMPAPEVGRLVKLKGQVRCDTPPDEVAKCQKCGREKPVREFMAPLKLNRRGYFGTCKECGGREL